MRFEVVQLVVFVFAGIGFTDFADCANNHLRRQFEFFANLIIAETLQHSLAKGFILKSNFADSVASGVETFHSSQKLLSLFGRRIETDFQCIEQ